MTRKSFFESMNREINLQQEYYKLERMVCEESIPDDRRTLNEILEKGFRNWKRKSNYTSFDELRNSFGFRVDLTNRYAPTYFVRVVDENAFFSYCEMLMNVITGTLAVDYTPCKRQVLHILETIRADLAKLNHMFAKTEDGEWSIVQCDAAASSAADLVPLEVGQAIIQYNHYLLRGDIEKKRNLLKIIADELEPKRPHLKEVNKGVEVNLFFLFNKMSIRHNNRDAGDKEHFNPVLVKLSNKEVEDWYDDTYQLALYAILIIDNCSRMKKVDLLKQNMIDSGS